MKKKNLNKIEMSSARLARKITSAEQEAQQLSAKNDNLLKNIIRMAESSL